MGVWLSSSTVFRRLFLLRERFAPFLRDGAFFLWHFAIVRRCGQPISRCGQRHARSAMLVCRSRIMPPCATPDEPLVHATTRTSPRHLNENAAHNAPGFG